MNLVSELRAPFLIVAVIFVCGAFGLEAASSLVLPVSSQSQGVQSQLGIPSLWLIDASLLCIMLFMAFSLVIDKNVIARVQGVVTLVLSIIVILAALKTLFTAFGALILMLALLSSFYGCVVYLGLFGNFNTGAAATVLGAATFFKVVAFVLLVLAQQRFLLQKGLIVLIAISLLCDLLLSVLHGFVPIVLVSVTDAIGAIVIAIIAIVYALVQAVFALIAVVRALA